MPRYYGAGPYGGGNYSAATGFAVAAAKGAFAQSGNTAAPTWQTRLSAGQGAVGVLGKAAMLSRQVVISVAGYHALAGQDAAFDSGSIWAADAGAAGEWMAVVPEDNGWTPATVNSQKWSER